MSTPHATLHDPRSGRTLAEITLLGKTGRHRAVDAAPQQPTSLCGALRPGELMICLAAASKRTAA